MNRRTQTEVDKIAGELGVTKRDHEADQGRIDRCERTLRKLGQDLESHREQTLEILAMHDEEYQSKIVGLDKRLIDQEILL